MVSLVCLVYLVCLVERDKPDERNRPDEPVLADLARLSCGVMYKNGQGNGAYVERGEIVTRRKTSAYTPAGALALGSANTARQRFNPSTPSPYGIVAT